MVTSKVLGISADGATDKTAAAWAILASALALGLSGDILLRAWPWGLNATIWLAGLCAVALALPRFESLALPRGRGTKWLWAALAFSLMLVWRSSPVLQSLNVSAVFLCLGMVAFRTTARGLRLAGSTEYGANLIVSAVQVFVGMGVLLARHTDWRSITASERSSQFRAFGRGIVIAALPILVFGALFASADIFFRDLLRDAVLLSPREAFSPSDALGVVRVAGGELSLGCTPCRARTFARNASNRLAPVRVHRGRRRLWADRRPLRDFRRRPVSLSLRWCWPRGVLIVADLSRICAARVLRARCGCGLGRSVLAVHSWLLPRTNARLHRIYACLATALVVLVFVVMASALQRMRLYQETFGLTELRVYTTAFMAWLFVVFAWLTFTVLRGRRDRFAFGTFMAGLAVLVGLNGLNPDALIVRRNAAIAGGERPFDSVYALNLSPDSVPSLLANFDKVSPAERCTVGRELRRRYLDLDGDWRTWSWARFRARSAVSSSRELATACDVGALSDDRGGVVRP